MTASSLPSDHQILDNAWKESTSIGQVILRIAIIIAVAEFLIMLLLDELTIYFPIKNDALFDTCLLSAMSTPLIYYWVILPFVEARNSALDTVSRLAHTDSLTELPNRLLFKKQFCQAVASIERHHHIGALLLLDLDKFKFLNDNFGHDYGDAMLVEIGRRLKSITRSEDTVARLGGDEFIVLINNLGLNSQEASSKAVIIATKLEQNINRPFPHNGNDLTVGVSIGIRLFQPEEEHNLDTLLHDADVSMYQAKKQQEQKVIFHQTH